MTLQGRMIDIKTPRWGMPLLQKGMRYRGAHGGRSGGKSIFFAEMLIDRCLRGTTRALCLRETQKSLSESVKKDLELRIEALKVEDNFIIQNSKIMHKTNKSEVLFIGMQNHTSASLKSYSGFDIAWGEEAQALSAKSIEMLLPTIRKPGSEIWFTWNPRYKTDAVEFLRNDPPPNSVCVEVNYYDNPWFEETALIDDMKYLRSRDIDRFNHVYLGEYEKNSEARVFKNWKVEEFEAPKDTIFRFGADFGYAIDPTVLMRCYIEGRKIFIDYEVFRYNCEIVNIPEMFGEIPESDLFPIVADSSRPETISHIRNNGYPKIFGSSKGKGSIIEGVEWLKSYDLIIHPRCKRMIDELTHYCYIEDKSSGQVTGKIKDENNHFIDALRYACEAVRKIENSNKNVSPPLPVKNYWNRG